MRVRAIFCGVALLGLALLAGAGGCGGRSVWANWMQDGGVAPDGIAPGPDGEVPVGVYGYVDLVHGRSGGVYGWDEALLTASFFGQDYDPQGQGHGLVETFLTADGATCDIYYWSGMIDDPPPDPPPQLDGGRLTASAGFDPNDPFEIFFNGTLYEADSRNPGSREAGWPAWLDVGAVAVTLAGAGSPHAGAFSREVFLAEFPESTTPSSDEGSLEVDVEGYFWITWLPSAADETQVGLSFNLDWDQSAFHCHLPAGADHLRIPFDWIAEWTWEYGELSVVALNEQVLNASGAAITLRAYRIHQHPVHFVMWE